MFAFLFFLYILQRIFFRNTALLSQNTAGTS